MSSPRQAVNKGNRRNSKLPASASLGATEIQTETNPLKKILKILGPGFITGASDDDPSGIGTYAIAGASLGFAFLWMPLLMFPLTGAVQFICAKVGMVTGRGLAGVVRQQYPKPILYASVFALMAANTINAGADLGAIGAAINLLAPIPIWLTIVPVTLIILVIQIWGSYAMMAKAFKFLALALLAYIGAAIFAKPDLHEVLRATFLPKISWNAHYLSVLVAILGTTISPYLFFWQASQEVEEDVAKGKIHLWQRRGSSDGELKYAAWDVNIGMLFSNVVMYFIILATAATLFHAGKTDINSAQEAAQALKPIAGRMAGALLAIGLIGSGFLAVPILTGSAAYALAEAFGWKRGFNHKPKRAREFYVMIAVSTLIGMGINFVGINPVKALFWTAVINGFLAPPLLVMIMLVANNRSVMGSRTNRWIINFLGWTAVVLMIAAAIGLAATWAG